ncbi:MAG: hypothetical protein Q9184_006417 [Pyrenodesmia sp. 2 TL-2023]
MAEADVVRSIIETNVPINCGSMPTLKPLLKKIIWRGDSKTARAFNYDCRSRSIPTGPNPLKTNGDTMIDASYIEMGPVETNRDVHITAADDSVKNTLGLSTETGELSRQTLLGNMYTTRGMKMPDEGSMQGLSCWGMYIAFFEKPLVIMVNAVEPVPLLYKILE